MAGSRVRPRRIRTKDEVGDALATDWLPLAANGERQSFAANIGASPKLIGRALSGENVPELHTALNSLNVSPDALFNTFRLFGGVFVPVESGPVDDFATIRQMMKAASEYLDRMQDNHRCHVDTAVLAKLFKPLIPSMLAIVREASGDSEPTLKAVA